MSTALQRYRNHPVWETLQLKRDALDAARFDDAKTEEWRSHVVAWLDEAKKTKTTYQPALYLSTLDALRDALNELPVSNTEFKTYVGTSRSYNSRPLSVNTLQQAIRSLPQPSLAELADSYISLLNVEAETRTEELAQIRQRISKTRSLLDEQRESLKKLDDETKMLGETIERERQEIKKTSESAVNALESEWHEAFSEWKRESKKADTQRNGEALEHIATLAATALAGEALAEHAAGDLSAADWYARAKRERRSAQWMRIFAAVAFIFAGAIGWFIVSEAIRENFELSLGDGILRAAVAVVVGSFGALLLREAGRHFREADTAEDVALSLKALAPFYANSEDEVRLAARVRVGDAVLVKNVLSRFANRDASKHSGEINTAELPDLVKQATEVLKPSRSELDQGS